MVVIRIAVEVDQRPGRRQQGKSQEDQYAHTGAGGLPHLAGELFILRSGAKMTGVSYRSGGESVTAVLSQAVHLTFENIAILASQIREGKLRALAAQNSTRTRLLPDCQPWPKLGVPNAGQYLLRLSRRPVHARYRQEAQ